MKVWDTVELLRYWGTASEYLHFRGTHARSACNPAWIDEAFSKLSPPGQVDARTCCTKRWAIGTIKPSGMFPDAKPIWEDFRG